MSHRPADLSEWCIVHLGAGAASVLWEAGHLSWVGGIALTDGREVVLKARPWRDSLPGCHAVHRHLWNVGFPCPEPLTGPTQLAGLAVSAEAHLPGGAPGRGDDPTLAGRTAAALAALLARSPEVTTVPSLEPPPAWVGWADPRARPWPPPDEGPPLNDLAATEPVRALAFALNERLRHVDLPPRVGHLDWYQGNLRWSGDDLVAVDDWDSVAALPEAAVVGCAAVSFRPGLAGTHPDTWPGAEVADTEAFLDHYQAVTARPFTAEEVEIAWAAGLWQRVFDAAKALASGRPGDAADQIRDASSRRRLAGLG